VRRSVQSHESRDIKALRVEIADEVRSGLQDYFADTPFRVVSLVVGNIDYPEVVAQAVEKKLAALQLLEEKTTVREIAKRDAEIRIEEAKGIAEAQRIINATLTPYYLQHEAIGAQLEMAQAPNHTTVYIPVGANGIPLVQTLPQGR
jgi:regulator of protease activity HflC (stomatin/prohibitin superfamily)